MKRLLTVMASLLALALASPASAISDAAKLIVDGSVAGVYRPSIGEGGLTYLMRHNDQLYAVQGDHSIHFIIDEVQAKPGGYQQMVHMLDGDDELVTFKLAMNQGTLTFPDGDAVYLTRVRELTRRDVAKVEPHLPVAEPEQTFAATESGPSFDCAKAGNQIEFLICGSSALSSMDLAMATGYKTLLSYAGDEEGKAYIRNQQRDWIGKRNTCRNADCLMQSYNERLLFIGDMIEYLNNN